MKSDDFFRHRELKQARLISLRHRNIQKFVKNIISNKQCWRNHIRLLKYENCLDGCDHLNNELSYIYPEGGVRWL